MFVEVVVAVVAAATPFKAASAGVSVSGLPNVNTAPITLADGGEPGPLYRLDGQRIANNWRVITNDWDAGVAPLFGYLDGGVRVARVRVTGNGGTSRAQSASGGACQGVARTGSEIRSPSTTGGATASAPRRVGSIASP